ncbi:pyridoxal-phosphate-dependent aminotransferase family protein [Selenihalanaerobacter shriftii]|uniref:Tritium exchange subunit n=1 Tax=Selenihalanaerobacter shriftii TaxID=142842 RepID=A0A1T4JJH9_9FIRM|nr:alanine--glyoxylate aminotransferase family protein [Selenihalanaerobacter shriftii]SJZ30330.1 aspartate aminotransferase [Selenihalanaerobacter shriftii]
MDKITHLQIPGPTNIPDSVLRAFSRPNIKHRGEEFSELVTDVIEDLKDLFMTENEILTFPSSGSGTMESAIVNTLSPGDKVLAISQGVFSNRFGDIAEDHGVEVERLEVDWNSAVNLTKLEDRLKKDVDKTIKTILLPHNETSTAITNDLAGIREAIDNANHPALLVVDAISSMGAIELKTDEWGVDIVVASSQKGLMLSPGLSIVSISDKAWEAVKTSKLSKWYWDYESVRENIHNGRFPYTPPQTLYFGLEESLRLIKEEGLENVFKRHATLATAFRKGIRGMGLELFAADEIASNSVTSICIPEEVDAKAVINTLKEDYGIIVGGGLSKLSGKIFRVGHLGAIYNVDIIGILSGIEMTFTKLGYNINLGQGIKAAQKSLLKI